MKKAAKTILNQEWLTCKAASKYALIKAEVTSKGKRFASRLPTTKGRYFQTDSSLHFAGDSLCSAQTTFIKCIVLNSYYFISNFATINSILTRWGL